MEELKKSIYQTLRWSEKYTKTDMVYLTGGAFWMNLNMVINIIFAFFLSIAFAHLLPKENYGLYQFILSIGSIFGAITLTGMNTALIQAVARGYEGSIKKSIPVQLFFGIIPFLVSLLFFVYYFVNGNLTIAGAILIVGLLTPIASSFNTYNALFGGRKDFKGGFIFSFILNFFYFLVMGTSLFFVKNPILLVGINLGINTLTTIILYFITIKKYKPNNKEDSSTIPYGKHLSLANIISIISNQLDNILIFHYVGATGLAIYTFASTVPEKFGGILKSIPVAALPKFSSQKNDDLRKIIFSKTLRFFIFNSIICGLYIVFAPLFFNIFFRTYSSAIFYSQIYAIGIAFGISSLLPIYAMQATQSKKKLYIFNLSNSIFSITFIFILASTYGIWGVVLAKVISSIYTFIMSLHLATIKKKNV